MSHMRRLVVLGGVVLSLQFVALLWLLSAPWDLKQVTVRGFTDPPDNRTVPQPEYPLQPASVTPYPDQPLDKVKRQPALADELETLAVPMNRMAAAQSNGTPPLSMASVQQDPPKQQRQ